MTQDQLPRSYKGRVAWMIHLYPVVFEDQHTLEQDSATVERFSLDRRYNQFTND